MGWLLRGAGCGGGCRVRQRAVRRARASALNSSRAKTAKPVVARAHHHDARSPAARRPSSNGDQARPRGRSTATAVRPRSSRPAALASHDAAAIPGPLCRRNRPARSPRCRSPSRAGLRRTRPRVSSPRFDNATETVRLEQHEQAVVLIQRSVASEAAILSGLWAKSSIDGHAARRSHHLQPARDAAKAAKRAGGQAQARNQAPPHRPGRRARWTGCGDRARPGRPARARPCSRSTAMKRKAGGRAVVIGLGRDVGVFGQSEPAPRPRATMRHQRKALSVVGVHHGGFGRPGQEVTEQAGAAPRSACGPPLTLVSTATFGRNSAMEPSLSSTSD